MKIALIDPDVHYQNVFKDFTKDNYPDVDVFDGTKDFGLAEISDYDVLFINHNLPGDVTANFLINSLNGKVQADVAIIGTTFSHITWKNAKDKRIKKLFMKKERNKYTHQKVLAWLDYVRIKKCIKSKKESELIKLFGSNAGELCQS